MGYRNYFSKLKKTDYDKEKLEKRDYDYRNKNVIELFELGKGVDKELRDEIKIIKDFEDGDTELAIIDIESILGIINQYAKKHVKFLKGLIGDYEGRKDYEIREIEYRKENNMGACNPDKYVKDQIRRWSNPSSNIYNIKKDTECLVWSWEYQYEVFELLRIYKTFNDKDYYLIWEGR